MKRKLLSLVLALAMAVSLFTVSASAAEPAYGDTAGHWAESSVDRWSDYGVVQGSNGLFNPNGKLTCAQLATILTRLLALPAAQSAGFTDNPVGAWYADAIDRCAAAGILLGNGDGTVNPTATISRERAMVMLGRALGIEPVTNPDLSKYGDAAQVAPYAQGMVAALIDAGIVGGVTADTLAPQGSIDRASTVTILDRAITTYVNTDGATVAATGGLTVVVANNVTVTGNTDRLLVPASEIDVLLESSGNADSVIITGSDSTVTVKDTGIGSGEVVGDRSRIILDSAAAQSVTLTGAKSSVETVGKTTIESVTVADTAANATVTTGSGTTISKVENKAEGTTVTGDGTVKSVESSTDVAVETKGTKVENAGDSEITVTDSKGKESTVDSGESATTAAPVRVHYHSYTRSTNWTTASQAGDLTSTESCWCGASQTLDGNYYINNAADLAAFRDWVNGANGKTAEDFAGKTIVLTASVDLGNNEWTPIGQKAGAKFKGTFDGNNKTVSGLKITSNETVNDTGTFNGYGALFGAIEGDAVVKNLTVSGTVTCASAAGIVARMNKGTVENCTSNVTVTGSEKAGGIVCLTNTSGCTIKNCTNNGTVSGPTTTGGIAAIVNSNTTVEGCTNNGAVGGDSSQIAGGIVATINGKWTNVNIGSCANNAAVTSQSSDTLTGKSGGIVGSVETGAKSGCSGTIKNCSNSGTISSTGNKSASGGIVGDIVDDFGIGLTVENNGCNSQDFSGKGTASDPYIIDSADKLSTLSTNVALGKIYCYQYFKLSTDLDMTSASFTPIGNSTYSFKGTFDGNSKTISNLNISSSTGSESLGLFVSTNRATIKDLTLNNVTVSGTTKVGALVGSMKGGTVENVKLTGNGTVTSSSYYAGGIVGYAESATISSCTNESTGGVKENTNNNSGVGGIIGGALKNTTVTNCTNSCEVSGTTNAGGIAGQVSAGTVSGCTNSGAVTVSGNYAGGIVGLAQLETAVSDNTNSGAVTATQKYAGGIVGAAVLSNKVTGNMTISGNTNTGTLTATDDKHKKDIVAYLNSGSSSNSIDVSDNNPSSQDSGGSD